MIAKIKNKMEQGGGNPIGTILSFMGNSVPTGYLYCDGTAYNIVDYTELVNFIETEFGTKNYFGGDGTTTFKVPDLRGEFLRCTGANSHTNQGNGANVGAHQDATTIPGNCYDIVTGGTAVPYNGGSGSNWILPQNEDKVTFYSSGSSWAARTGQNTASPIVGRYSTRPTNTSVKYCIKF